MDGGAAGHLQRYVRWHLVIWKLGGARERGLFALLCATAYVFLPVTLIWVFVSGWGFEFPWEFYVTLVIAATNILLLIDVLGIAVYTRDSLEELLRIGHFSNQEAVASEYLAYIQSHGDGKRLRSAARVAALDFALFYGLVVLSIAFGLFVLPVVGSPTPALFFAIDAPTVLVFRRFSRKKQPILYGLPDSAGVQLSEPMFSRFP